MVIGSMGYFTDPYKWGIPWGYNPLILTFDPNFLEHPSTLLGMITYPPPVGAFESMIFLFTKWDILGSWRVFFKVHVFTCFHHSKKGQQNG